MNVATESALEAARALLSGGGWPVPVPAGAKRPVLPGWPSLRLREAELPAHFPDGANIGEILGVPPGNSVDVDCDAPEAIALAPRFLPATDRIHGRPGKPLSHWWYTCNPLPKTERFQDLDGATLVELRSAGGQTILPPSIHPSGEKYVWHRAGPPAPVRGAELRATVARVAAAALLVRHWPEQGRHFAALALGGLLLRGGMDEAASVHFVEAVARATGDEEGGDRVRAVQDSAKTLVAGEPATGGPTLAELLRGDGLRVVERVRAWLNLSAPRTSQTDSRYTVAAGQLCRVRDTKDGPVLDALANFTATVTEEILQDDGVETTRAFMIQGRLDSGEPLPAVRVPASRFAAMSWVTEHWGLRAVVRAGQTTRDYLREAIQRLSPDAPRRRIFTHTGWHELNGEWFYLTSSGAVGREGFEVDLDPALRRYQLPRQAEDPTGAMQASLRLLEVAPLTVTAPLWAGVFRAPLASALPLDLTLWLEAQTGNLKSSLAALFLCHYGDFDRTHLSAAWSSTANQLERRAFILKDTVCVIDDYSPSPLDAREMEAKAARVIRAQGNLAGRGRLRADLTERPGFPPRGLIISSGEQHPSGQSLLARMLLIEPRRQDIDLAALREAQREAARLPHAMAAYVAWLAPQLPTLPPLLRETFEGTRAQAASRDAHLRVPEALAHLWVGLHSGLTFAQEIGACTAAAAAGLEARCWAAFLDLGIAQSRLVEDERPSRRFLRVLLTLVSQGRAVLLAKEEASSDHRIGVDLVGWQDEEALYLLSDAAYQAVSRFCRDAGEPFPVRRERLQKDLALEGLAEAEERRHTKTVRLGGRTRRVLWLKRRAVADLLGEDFPCPSPVVTGITSSAE